MNETKTSSFLNDQDPEPFRIINPASTTPILLVCDHASNFIPAHLNQLDASDEAIADHVAWDPGAAIITERLANALDCPAVLCNYSRLVIDVNRNPETQRDTMIPEVSDHYVITKNTNLSEAQIQTRIDEIHEPYHRAISARLDALNRLQVAPLVFSIHSFTQKMKGEQQLRPWHAGLLWNADPRLAMPLMTHLNQHDHLVIGNNEPYSGKVFAYTMDRHGHDRGFPNCAIELRQDLLQSEEDYDWWVQHLGEGLRRVLAIPGIHQQKIYDLPTS